MRQHDKKGGGNLAFAIALQIYSSPLVKDRDKAILQVLHLLRKHVIMIENQKSECYYD